MEAFDDDLATDFEEWFEEIPPDEIVLPADEVPPVSSSDEGFGVHCSSFVACFVACMQCDIYIH